MQSRIQILKGNCKILVAYASEFGTTREVAEVIGETLCQDGAKVDIKPVNAIINLPEYDAIVIGSAIQYDKWMAEAITFVKKNHNTLSKLPVAFFFTCLTLSRQTERTKRTVIAYTNKLYSLHPQVKPVSVGRFAGVLDYSKIPFIGRIIARGIYKIFGVKEGDYRDWNAIRAWSRDVYFKFNLKVAENETC